MQVAKMVRMVLVQQGRAILPCSNGACVIVKSRMTLVGPACFMLRSSQKSL